MDNTSVMQAPPSPSPAPLPTPAAARKPKSLLWRGLEAVASLKLTVFLFALAMFLVFYGTIAQVELGIWSVVNDYFRSVVVFIPVKVLLLFRLPADAAVGNVRIPFPGGWLIGGALFANLIAAHIVRFKLSWKRSGIIVLHFGIMLMMLGEWLTGMFAIESMMSIREGETVNYVHDNRNAELAIVEVTDPKRKTDDIVSISAAALQKKDAKISSEDLPFEIEVLQYEKNSDLVTAKGEIVADADRGQAAGYAIKPLKEGTGVDTSQRVDTPSAVVKLTAKNGEALGTYLLSYWLGKADAVTVGGKSYEIILRPKRSYRDYTVTLEKAEERKHPNLEMAKDYSSYIVLNDPEHGVVDRKTRIYMNAPMRYRGEAFFQANMSTERNGDMVTGLQVVRNELILPVVGRVPFWTLPYISCIVVALGMLIHFGIKLIGFLELQMRARA
jgi:hypothetical protein